MNVFQFSERGFCEESIYFSNKFPASIETYVSKLNVISCGFLVLT